jgi:hypothetical protein
VAAPREHDREALAREFERYIETTDIPIVAEFAAETGLYKPLLYGWREAPCAPDRATWASIFERHGGALKLSGIRCAVEATGRGRLRAGGGRARQHQA